MEGRERKGKEGRRLLPLFILKRRKLGNTCIWEVVVCAQSQMLFFCLPIHCTFTPIRVAEKTLLDPFSSMFVWRITRRAQRNIHANTPTFDTSPNYLFSFFSSSNGVWEKQGKERHEDWTCEQTGQIKKPAPRSPRVYINTHTQPAARKIIVEKEGGGCEN